MKKLIIGLFFFLLSFTGYSQLYYKAYKTELYTYNLDLKKYELYSKNSDNNITVVIEKESVNIQANSPTMFYVSEKSKKDISTETYNAYRYNAVELKNNKECIFDIVYFKNSDETFLSITYKEDLVNLRYYLIKQ